MTSRQLAFLCLALCFTTLLTACETSDPVGPFWSAFFASVVVEGTVSEVASDGLSIESGTLYAELAKPGAKNDVAAIRSELPNISLRKERGDYEVGQHYAVFVGRVDANGVPLIYGLYGHDLSTDLPIEPWSDEKTYLGRTAVDILDCLVVEFGTEGQTPRLDALILAVTDAHGGDPQIGSEAFNRCSDR